MLNSALLEVLGCSSIFTSSAPKLLIPFEVSPFILNIEPLDSTKVLLANETIPLDSELLTVNVPPLVLVVVALTIPLEYELLIVKLVP